MPDPANRIDEWLENDRPRLERTLRRSGADLFDLCYALLLEVSGRTALLLQAQERSLAVLERLAARVQELERRTAELEARSADRRLPRKGQ